LVGREDGQLIEGCSVGASRISGREGVGSYDRDRPNEALVVESQPALPFSDTPLGIGRRLIRSEEPATGGCVLRIGLVKEIRELFEGVSGLE
jgi:hypothetical protein